MNIKYILDFCSMNTIYTRLPIPRLPTPALINVFLYSNLEVVHKESPEFWGMVTEAYALSLSQMVRQSIQVHDYDIFRFVVQVANELEKLTSAGIGLMQLGDDCVVMDFDGNFRLANLDENSAFFGNASEGAVYKKEIIKYRREKSRSSPMAPEAILEGRFDEASLVWDFGVLILKIFTGTYPKVQYSGRKVGLDFKNKKDLSSCKKIIRDLIHNCLKFNRNDRPRLGEIKLLAREGLSQVASLFERTNDYFLKETLTRDNEVSNALIKIGDMVPLDGLRENKVLNEFKHEVKPRPIDPEDKSPRKLVKLILKISGALNREALDRLVTLSWSSPGCEEEIFAVIFEQLERLLSNQILVMKLLFLLNDLVSKGRKEVLKIQDKGSGRLAVNVILERLLSYYESKSEGMIFAFSYFEYVKFNFLRGLPARVENNLTVSKAILLLNYSEVLKPSLFERLMKYVSFVYSFLLGQRKFSFDYFFRQLSLLLAQELQSTLGLMCNLLVYYLFGYVLHEDHQEDLHSDIKIRVFEMLRKAVSKLDVIRKGFNIFLEHAEMQGFPELGGYRFRHNFSRKFAENKTALHQQIKGRTEVEITIFTKYYLNSLARMNPPQIFMKMERLPSTHKQASYLRSEFGALLKSLLEVETVLESMIPCGMSLVPKAVFWYAHVKQKRLQSRESGSRSRSRSENRGSNFKRSQKQRFANRSPGPKAGGSKRNVAEVSQKRRTKVRHVGIQVNMIRKFSKSSRSKSRDGRRNGKGKDEGQKGRFNEDDASHGTISFKGSVNESNKRKKNGKDSKERPKETGKDKDKDKDKDKNNNNNKSQIKKSIFDNSQGGNTNSTKDKVDPEQIILKSYIERDDDVIVQGENISKYIMKEFRQSLDSWIIKHEDLEFADLLSTGSTCDVYRGRYRNIDVAIKQLKHNKRDLNFKYMKEFKREMGVLISLPNHPNLLTMIGFSIKEGQIFLITQYCQGGSLFDVLHKKKSRKHFTFKQQLKILMDICRGMQFLHELNRSVIHRDLKSLNIFIDNKIEGESMGFQTTVADFGLARTFSDPNEFVTLKMGTFHWMAPELFDGEGYSSKTDVYAFAIIMWEVFALRTPYYHIRDINRILAFVTYKNGRPSLSDCKVPSKYEKEIREIIRVNWHKDGTRRKEFSEIYGQLERIMENHLGSS